MPVNDGEIHRDEGGRFKKGYKVPAPRSGRPSRTNSMPVLVAVAEQAYSAEELVEMLHETYDMARDNDDWKGMMTVIQFVVNYAVGKPVQRTLTANVDPDWLKGFFVHGESRQDEASQGDDSGDDVIDVE